MKNALGPLVITAALLAGCVGTSAGGGAPYVPLPDGQIGDGGVVYNTGDALIDTGSAADGGRTAADGGTGRTADSGDAVDTGGGVVDTGGGCTPNCAGKACGDNGCGGICGTCPANANCVAGMCKTTGCTSQCDNKTCGDDGCGGVCGLCGNDQACVQGNCQDKNSCVKQCAGKNCGPDGCGGSCGGCTGGQVCTDGLCITPSCTPKCAGKTCGDDACGGVCGVCGPDQNCVQGNCKGAPPCTPNCAGKSCGSDGCGKTCGTCNASQSCQSGKCVTPPAPGCQGVSYEGCCGVNQVLQFCESGTLKTIQCQSGKVCGWNADSKFYDCVDKAKCAASCADPSGKNPISCKAGTGVKVVSIQITSAVVAPFKADRCQWDGLTCSAASQKDADALADLAGGLVGAIGSAGWGLAVTGILKFVGKPAMQSMARPDPYGTAQIFMGGKWSAEIPLATKKNKTSDTFTPIFPGPPKPPGWQGVALTAQVRVRVTLWDADLYGDDPIGVAEISNAELQGVLKTGKSEYVNTAKDTANQLLLVKMSVAAAN